MKKEIPLNLALEKKRFASLLHHSRYSENCKIPIEVHTSPINVIHQNRMLQISPQRKDQLFPPNQTAARHTTK